MLDVKSQIVLGLYVIVAACVLVIARVGHFVGALGATVTALSLWIVLTACLQATLLDFDDGWRDLLIVALFTSTPLFVVFLPMLLSTSHNWLRGRLTMGVAGAVVYAWVMWLVVPSVISR